MEFKASLFLEIVAVSACSPNLLVEYVKLHFVSLQSIGVSPLKSTTGCQREESAVIREGCIMASLL